MKIDVEVPETSDPVQDSLAKVAMLCRLAFAELNTIQSRGDEETRLLGLMQGTLNHIVGYTEVFTAERNGT